MFWKKKTDTVNSASAVQDAGAAEPKKKGLFSKLRERLRATRESITQKALNLFRMRGKIDNDLLDDLEEVLISADVGVDTTMALIEELRERIKREKKE